MVPGPAPTHARDRFPFARPSTRRWRCAAQRNSSPEAKEAWSKPQREQLRRLGAWRLHHAATKVRPAAHGLEPAICRSRFR